MKLKILENTFSICKVNELKDIDFSSNFLFIGKTEEEISIVCDENHTPKDYTKINKNWKCIQIVGTLDFSLIGILSKITTILAQKQIGIFVVSTYNTDYILVKEDNMSMAKKSLEENDYIFV